MEQIHPEASPWSSSTSWREYHGKGPCDSHFSTLTKHLENSTKSSAIRAYSLLEMVKLLRTSIDNSNKLKLTTRRKSPIVDVSLLIYDRSRTDKPLQMPGIVEFGPSTIKPYCVVVANFTAFYHFALDEDKLNILAREYRDADDPIKYASNSRISPAPPQRSNFRTTNYPKLPKILLATLKKLKNRSLLRSMQKRKPSGTL